MKSINPRIHLTLLHLLLCLAFPAVTFATGMSGSYSIGPSGSFQTFSQAVTALITNGVNGPVNITVANGVYTEQVTVTAIPGTSSVNTVTFQSASGDSTTVTLSFTPIKNDSTNYTLKLSGSTYITFKHLTLTTGGSLFGTVLTLGSNANYDTFQGNRFLGIHTQEDSIKFDLVQYLLHQYHHDTHFKGNYFSDGSYGIDENCHTSAFVQNTSNNITDNRFFNQCAAGISLNSDSQTLIDNNLISSSDSSMYGIHVSNSNSYSDTITRNTILFPKLFYGAGIYVEWVRQAFLANNVIDITCARMLNNVQGIHFQNVSGTVSVVFNTVHLNPSRYSTFNTCALEFEGPNNFSNPTTLQNNIFSEDSTLALIYYNYNSLPQSSLSNYLTANDNALFTPDTFACVKLNTTNYGSLKTWQRASGKDSNSVFLRTHFNTAPPLFCPDSFLFQKAVPISWVNTDIKGNPRSATHPCIGAYEFNYLPPDTVWPGDANSDLVANNLDLLAVGLYYGQTGSSRNAISNVWSAQPCYPWAGNEAVGCNINQADCNGDGIVNSADTVAILQNYSLLHPHETQLPTNSGPSLHFSSPTQQYAPGSWVTLQLETGDSAHPISGLYGLASTINFPVSLIQPGTVSISFPPGWMGTYNADLLAISKSFTSSGSIDLAISRKDHRNRTGYGKVALFTFQVSQGITVASSYTISHSGTSSLDSAGVPVPLSAIPYTLSVSPAFRIQEASEPTLLKIYPNPFEDAFNLSYSLTKAGPVSVELDNISGQFVSELYTGNQEAGTYECWYQFPEKLAPGLYFIRLKTGTGSTRLKLLRIARP